MANEPEAPVRGKRFGCWGILLTVLLVLLAGYAAFRIVLRMQVRARLKAIAAEGYPTTLNELDAWYPSPPEGQNAADIYQRAFDAYVMEPPEFRSMLPSYMDAADGESLPHDARSGATHIANNKQSIRLLHQAAGMSQCRYRPDLSQGVMMRLPHLEMLRHAARLLALDAIIHAEDGKPEEAARSVSSGLALGQSLDREPIGASHMVRISCDSTAMEALSRVLSHVELSHAAIEQLSRALRKAEASEGLNRGMVEVSASVTDALDRRRDLISQHGPVKARIMMAAYTASGLKDADLREWLDLMRKALHATKMPCEQRVVTMKGVEREAHAFRRHFPIPQSPISDVLSEALVSATVSDVRRIALLRAARTALAVERYRQVQGKLPDKLGDLCPDCLDAVPADPFDGAPLRYKVLDKGYIVYSIGPDGKDDGGAEKHPLGGHPAGQPHGEDIVFRVAR